MNPKMRNISVAKTVNQAIDYVRSNPCCICSYESFCGVKYKGTCKIARQLRIALYYAKKIEENDNEGDII